MTIDWRSDVLYWSDNDLEYIMAAKVTGHLHRKLVEDTGKAQGIAVDPINNRSDLFSCFNIYFINLQLF